MTLCSTSILSSALSLLLLTTGQGTANAQSNLPAPSGPTRYNRAPISNELLEVHLPRAVKRTLPNGVRVLVLEDHHAASISMIVYINGAGGLFDPADQPGLASMTAQMLSLGTSIRTSKQIAQATDTYAASLNVNAGSSSSTVSLSASGLSSNFDNWSPIVTDVLLHPSFPENELATAKQRQLSQLQSQASDAGFLANKYLRHTLYGDTPEGVVSATPESTKAFTAEALRSFYRLRYTPQSTIVVIGGDITPAKAFAFVSDALGAWPKTDLQVGLPPVTEVTAPRSVTLVDRPNSVQTNLVLGRLGIDRRDPDYVKLAVTNNILGSGAAGRLFMRLREEKSYTYGAYGSLDATDYRGVITANSEVRTQVTGGALDEFFHEFSRLGTEPVSLEELKRHKHSMVAMFALSLESPQTLMGDVFLQERYGFPEDYWDRYAAALATVSADDVMAMGKKYYSPETMEVIAVGDPEIKPVLAKWGDVKEIKP